MRQLLLVRESEEQNKLSAAGNPENASMSYLETYFKKYWILSGQSVRQKKLSLLVMLLEYKKCICTEA